MNRVLECSFCCCWRCCCGYGFYLFIYSLWRRKKLVEMIKRREREQGKYFNKRAQQQQQKEKSHLIRDFLSLSLDLTKKDERKSERTISNLQKPYYKKYFCRLNNCDIVIYPLLFVSYCIYRSKQQKNDFIILLTNVVGLIVVQQQQQQQRYQCLFVDRIKYEIKERTIYSIFA